MKTPSEQQAFFESQWGAMRQAAETAGVEGVNAFLDGHGDGIERRVLLLNARQGLVMRAWEGRTLDVYVGVLTGGIRSLLDEAQALGEQADARKRTELANVLSYNLAADLAHAWPDDGMERTAVHFEAGLAAAEACIRWRSELEKGDGPLSMAWWAKAMHQMSLGRMEAAATSFEHSLKHAEADAESEEDFGVVLGQGYLALARWSLGQVEGRAMYRDAMKCFANQLMDEERKDDARFGIDQLELVRSRYGPDEPVE